MPSLSSGLSAAAAFPDSCRGIKQSLIAVRSGTQPRRGQPPLPLKAPLPVPPLPLKAPLPVQTHSPGYIGWLQSGTIYMLPKNKHLWYCPIDWHMYIYKYNLLCTISVKCIFRPLYIWSTCTHDWWRACVICFLGFKSNVFFIIVNYAWRIWSVSKRIRGYSSTCQILKYIWHLTARDQANKTENNLCILSYENSLCPLPCIRRLQFCMNQEKSALLLTTSLHTPVIQAIKVTLEILRLLNCIHLCFTHDLFLHVCHIYSKKMLSNFKRILLY